ncbi:MAG: hypothetical protein ACR2NV_00505 [Thermoleophilaceae bacterium]
MALPRLALALLGVLALTAPAAEAASLPAGGDGERPGPPMLYEPPPKVPQLSNRAPFAADPLLVSGTDAYRDGEYLYQDYLFDDRGANTAGGAGTRPKTKNNYGFSPTAGDYLYPTDKKYGRNAADIVEFRVKPTPQAIVYRVTLNTVKADDATVVGIGIDTNPASGGDADVLWPDGTGMRSPGLDRFVTAWGTGGKVTECAEATCAGQSNLPPGAVTIDRETNQMTIRVPRRDAPGAMDPGLATWRYVLGAGVYESDTNGFRQVEPGTRADEDEDAEPSKPRTGSATASPVSPAVFNLGFRFDEPQAKAPFTQNNPVGVDPASGVPSSAPSPYDTFPGIGNWFEDKQAHQLRLGTTRDMDGDATPGEDLAADVNFSRLDAGASEPLHNPRGCPPEPAPATCEQARIMTSSTPVPEGVRDEFPQFGGPLQPYSLTVPAGDDGRRRGLTFSLHSLDATYTQYSVFSPNQLLQFGDQRDDYVVTTLGRGFDGWYMNEGERDFFDAWRDVASRFPLDSERVALTGYSMGGYGTYKLGVEYPDLFGRAFTTVGPPARGVWPAPAPPSDPESGRFTQFTNTQPRLESLRWVPFLNWIEMADDLVPFIGPKEQQRRFDELGLRSRLLTFQGGEHLTLATVDGWKEAADFLGEAEVKRDPSRVSYAFMPDADAPDLGLVHDHAYWVSDLRVRDRSGDPGTDPARGEIDARSLAFGEGDPSLRRIFTPSRRVDGPPDPFNIAMEEGTDWTGLAQRDGENALDLRLENVERARIAGSRARLDSERDIRVRLESDGDAEVRLDLQLPADSVVRRDGSNEEADDADVDSDGASFRVGSGTSTFVIARRKPAASTPSGESPPGAGSGARSPACLPRIPRLGSRGIGPVRLGRTRAAVLVATGLPARSARRVERYCLQGGGKLLVSFSRDARVRLAVVVAPGPLARGIGRGSSVRRLLGRYPTARATLRGVLAASRGSSALFGVKATRVRFVAVADRRLRADPALLASHLRRLGLR